MKRYVALLALALLVLSAAAAQQSAGGTVMERFPSSLGAYGNSVSTGGLSYQRWFGRAGLQLALGGIAYPGANYDYNIHVGGQYLLYAEDFADWFSGGLYGCGYVAHRGSGSLESGAVTYNPVEYLGLGVGIEMVFLRHLSLNAEVMYVGSYPLALEFGFAGGLRYRF